MSQFDTLFKTTAKEEAEDKPKKKQVKNKSIPSLSPAIQNSPSVQQNAESSVPVKSQKRPGGKSSNPEYTQVLSYVRKDTHNAVKAALIYDAEKRDLSDLVEELFNGWLKTIK